MKKELIEDADELEGWNFKFGFFLAEGVYEVFLRKGQKHTKRFVTKEVYEELEEDG